MQPVNWRGEYSPPKHISGIPMWLSEADTQDQSSDRSPVLIGTTPRQSGEFLKWAAQQRPESLRLANIKDYQLLQGLLIPDADCLVDGRFVHFVLAGIVFMRPEQIRTVEKVTVAGKTHEETTTVTVDVAYVPVMNLCKIDGRPAWGVALYPANQYGGYLGGADTALIFV